GRRASVFLLIVPAPIAVVGCAVGAVAAIARRHARAEGLAVRLGHARLVRLAVGGRARIGREHAFVARERISLGARARRDASLHLARGAVAARGAGALLVRCAADAGGVVSGIAG